MKYISIIFLFILLFTQEIPAQLKDKSFISDSTKLTNNSPQRKLFDVNQRFTFDFGVLFCVSRQENAVSNLAASYDLNIVAKKLYCSAMLGLGWIHEEGGGGPVATFGLGFDYSVYSGHYYKFSVYAGAQGWIAFAPAGTLFGVVHLRNAWMVTDNLAFTFGMKYLLQYPEKEHWLMPTFGYQLFLR